MHAWAATIRAVASRDEPVPEHLESLHANGGRLQIVRSDVLSWEATSAQLQPPLLAACGTKVYAEPEAYDGNFTVNELDPEGKLQGTQPGPSIEAERTERLRHAWRLALRDRTRNAVPTSRVPKP
eukprot:6280037-Amphidinium_carterae.1